MKEQVAVGVDVECVFLSDVIFWGGIRLKAGQRLSGPVVRWKPSANFFTIGDIPLAIPIDKVDIRPNCQDCQDWLTENLPETNAPASTRPGAEYGVDV